jgi:hypothetical protein
MKAAVIVGINYYEFGTPLYGCVNDAHSVKNILERNADGSINFECTLFTASSSRESITRSILKDTLRKLFSIQADTVLFYFSGHGHIEINGGYLMVSNSQQGDDGIPLDYIMALAKNSPASNKVIILDSCYSGIAGDSPDSGGEAILTEGLTILTSSTDDQYSVAGNESSIFTSLLIDALAGSAADLLGNITPGSIYAHIDQALGAFEQRPLFKTNVSRFVSLRQATPSIQLEDLRKIARFFPMAGFEFQLNPTFEPEMKGRDEGMPLPIIENTEIFALLQKYNRLNLLIPIGCPHMWHAAMTSKSCKLTALGEHYRRLAAKGRFGSI